MDNSIPISNKSVKVLEKFLEGKTFEFKNYSCDITKALSKKKRDANLVSTSVYFVTKVSWKLRYSSTFFDTNSPDKNFRVDLYSVTDNKNTHGYFEVSQVFDLMTAGYCHLSSPYTLVFLL